jgi:uncharacterized protein
MQALAEAIVPFVVTFMAAQYGRAMSQADGIVFIATGEMGQTGCGEPYTDSTLAYCPLSNRIFLGQEALWQLYSGFGDAAPVLVLAHEWRHFVQEVAGIPSARSAAETIPREDQADCFAGSFMNFALGQQWLELPDDLQDIGAALVAAGEFEGPERTHGTPEERLRSFDMGFGRGTAACNVFFPNSPLLA